MGSASISRASGWPRLKRAAGRALLVLPLALFLVLVFFTPLAGVLRFSVLDTELAAVMPRTVEVLSSWSGDGVPPAAAYDAVARDLVERAAPRRSAPSGAGWATRAPPTAA